MKTLYTNGTIVTMDPLCPQGQALVTQENRIIGIGDTPAMTELAGTDCKIVDMEQGTLFPGFNETHNHLSMYALYLSYAYLGACETIDDLLSCMKKHADGTSSPVVVGYSYDDTLLKDGRPVTRHDLDEICPDRPVCVIHISGHLGFLNTKGLEYFNITPQVNGR